MNLMLNFKGDIIHKCHFGSS